MGQSTSGRNMTDEPRVAIENIGGEIIRQARSITEIATFSYNDLQESIKQLNSLSNSMIDSRGRKLQFVVKKGTDTTILWKTTVRIACVSVDVNTNKIQSYKLLTLSQLLNAAHTLRSHREAAAQSAIQPTAPEDPFNSSVFLAEFTSLPDLGESLGECCICLERKPEVILPCAHSYCLPCIEQWNVNHKTCPICREKLNSTDDSWVISEAPGSDEISEEIENSLLNLSGS